MEERQRGARKRESDADRAVRGTERATVTEGESVESREKKPLRPEKMRGLYL